MGLKLLHSGSSPYVRKVMVLLHETGLVDQVELIPGSGTPLAPNEATVGANPIGKVPVLLRDDGPSIYDSRVICRYLDDHAGGKFYPASRLWEVLTLEATAEGILDAALLMVYENRLRSEETRSTEWVEAQWAKITRSLDAIEDRWISHMHGPLTMGQIAVACALGYLDLRHDARQWREGRLALAAWFAKFEDRASMQATLPVG
ncbi:MAG: glutathione S-transferase [Boseongicola sp.]|nr:glutathione S-transferase [Boseongicola sp.]MDD9976948.1 glutathione S-transferase [Boseongicola sp.]